MAGGDANGRRGRLVLTGLAAASMLALVILALGVAPQAANFAGVLTHRILYFHVPSAWAAYLAFLVTAIASVIHLFRETPRSDRIAAASVEVGTIFSLIALVTGLLWSRVEFGAAYSPFADPKVVSLVVLILAYIAYLTLRSGIDEPARRGRLSAVFGLLAFVSVPASYYASRISVHPEFVREGSGIAGELLTIMLFGTFAFTLLYASLVWLRYDLELLREAVREGEAAPDAEPEASP